MTKLFNTPALLSAAMLLIGSSLIAAPAKPTKTALSKSKPVAIAKSVRIPVSVTGAGDYAIYPALIPLKAGITSTDTPV
ncbi:MAG: hypothetical protein WCL39_11845, partial [Armatimonadota bacterium]